MFFIIQKVLNRFRCLYLRSQRESDPKTDARSWKRILERMTHSTSSDHPALTVAGLLAVTGQQDKDVTIAAIISELSAQANIQGNFTGHWTTLKKRHLERQNLNCQPLHLHHPPRRWNERSIPRQRHRKQKTHRSGMHQRQPTRPLNLPMPIKRLPNDRNHRRNNRRIHPGNHNGQPRRCGLPWNGRTLRAPVRH